MASKLISRWPFLVASAASLGMVAARMIWPALTFDNSSLILFGIAIATFLLPFIPLKKVKWGDFEAELDREIDTFEKRVVATEAASAVPPSKEKLDSAAITHGRGTWVAFYDQYSKLVNSPSTNPEKILGAGLLLEKMILTAAEVLTPEEVVQLRTPKALVDRFAQLGLMTQAEKAAYIEFANLRNTVVHSGLHVSDEQTIRILDLVGRLVRALA
jgi:hypothetical protein